MPQLTNRDITRDLEDIVSLFINSNPSLQKKPLAERDQLTKVLLSIFTEHLKNNNNGQLFKNDMSPTFIKQLNSILAIGTQLNKTVSGKHDSLIDNLKKILEKNGLLDKNGQLDKQKLLKLDPKQLAQLQLDLKNFCKDTLTNTMKLTMKPGKNNTDKIANDIANALTAKGNEQDPYANLLGVINSRISGGVPIVIQCFIGNGLNIADVNPENGMAQIDQENRAFVGLEADPGSELVNEFITGLQQAGLAPNTSPRPGHGEQ